MDEIKNVFVGLLIVACIFLAGVGFGYFYLGAGKRVVIDGGERAEDAEVQRKLDESLATNATRNREIKDERNRSLETLSGTGDLMGAEIRDIGVESGLLLQFMEEVGSHRFVLEEDGGRYWVRFLGDDSLRKFEEMK
jgi:hypothetical protein